MATLTSTGEVNLTASTNWSPAQIPVAGDDLVIGAHTLTLDDDLTLGSVVFTATTSRLAIGGTTRTVNSTNGWDIQGVNISARLITTDIASGMTVILRGTWKSTTTLGSFQSTGIATASGGSLTLATIGDDPSGVLFDMPNVVAATRVITTVWTSGTLTTIGRFNLPTWTAPNTLVTMTGGTWNHTNTGTSQFGVGTHRICNLSSTAVLNWTGDVESYSAVSSGGLFTIAGSGNIAITGGIKLLNSVAASGAYTSIIAALNATGTITLTGVLCVRNNAMSIWGQLGSGGRINWRDQSISLGSTENVILYMNGTGTLDITDLIVSNAGKFIILVSAGATSVATGTSTLITNTTTSAQAAVYTAAGELDGKVINLASDAPTLPAVEDVAGGTVYGYSISPLTGTGVINDPAVIAAAVGTALDNISSTATNIIADKVLSRNVSNVESTAGEHTLATVILSMLEWEISGSDLIIKRTDGTTVHYTKTLSSTTGSGDVITGLN